MEQNYYTLLSVPSTATTAQIQSAFRKQALVDHPDKGGDPARFRAIRKAQQTLCDPSERASYDRGIATEKNYGKQSTATEDCRGCYTRDTHAHFGELERMVKEMERDLEKVRVMLEKRRRDTEEIRVMMEQMQQDDEEFSL